MTIDNVSKNVSPDLLVRDPNLPFNNNVKVRDGQNRNFEIKTTSGITIEEEKKLLAIAAELGTRPTFISFNLKYKQGSDFFRNLRAKGIDIMDINGTILN